MSLASAYHEVHRTGDFFGRVGSCAIGRVTAERAHSTRWLDQVIVQAAAAALYEKKGRCLSSRFSKHRIPPEHVPAKAGGRDYARQLNARFFRCLFA